MSMASREMVKKWYKHYDQVCDHLGVNLAGVQNPAKACQPSQQGLLLGINLDLVDMGIHMEYRQEQIYI